MAYDSNNIFARILRGEIPNKTVLETDHALAFHDINPQAPVHVLVIPKGAYVDMIDFGARASATEIQGFYKAVSDAATMLGVNQSGCRIIANTGLHGGQEVPHFHVHIIGGKQLGRMLGE
jgi:histidine triad (HIT) family protein